jgi:Domain of unknown function (DUF6647)
MYKCKAAVLWVLLLTCGSAVSAVAQPFAGVQSSTPPRVESLEQRSVLSPIKYTPEGSTLTGIVVWLADNFNLPNIHEYPDIQFASAEDLIGMKYNGYFIGRSGAQSQDTRQDQHEIEAVYNDVLKTIFLRLEWTGKTSAEQSMLVHEMVHHLQNLGQLKYDCPSAREKIAYEAQDCWLRQFDKHLQTEFQIDPFSMIVKTTCPF